MSRRRDYHMFYDDSLPVKQQDETGSIGSTDSRRRFQRSASIAVATEPTSSGLSFILDMDKEEAFEHSHSLHEDIEKMFDKSPRFNLDELTSGTIEAVPSTIGIVEEETPKWADRHFDDGDFKSHRRASFPHTHHVLGSISSHSSKNFAAMIEEAKEDDRQKAKRAKKEKKEKKERKEKKKPKQQAVEKLKQRPIFPSKSATMSPAIPEVEVEEFTSVNEMDSDDSEDDDYKEELVGESEVSLPQLGDRKLSLPQLGDRKLSPEIIVTDTSASSGKDRRESTPRVEHIPSPRHVSRGISPLAQDSDRDRPLLQFDDVDSKLLPLPKVSSILSSGSSSLSDYTDTTDKIPVSESGSSIVTSDPNLLRVKQSDSDARSRSPSISPHPGFYIGSNPERPDTPVVIDDEPVVILLEDPSSLSDDDNEMSPLISTAADPPPDLNIPTSQAVRVSIDKVMFQLGDHEEEPNTGTVEEEEPHYIWRLRGEEEEGVPEKEENKKGEQETVLDTDTKDKEDEAEEGKDSKKHRKGSSKSIRSESGSKSGHHKRRHHHHHHHGHHKKEDLLSRRQRGSEVMLADALHRVPTETEEAIMLHKADLDEMTSHRFEDPQGMRRHKIERKKHKTVSSVVHIGKAKKYFKPSKKFDHSPHEVFVELDELYHGDKYEWREKARWIKFEEDVEEGADRWGKPHVASLSFHSLIELRKGLESGSLLLDLEESDLSSIVDRVVNDMVMHDQIKSENKGRVRTMLLMKHKFVGDGSVKTLIRRNKSFQNLFGLDERHQKDQMSLLKTFSSASLAQRPSVVNLQSLEQQGGGKQVKRQVSRSLSVPNDHFTGRQLQTDVEELAKISKIKQNGAHHDPGKLEFVKVDVDNDMANDVMKDGVHIGIVPETKDQKSDQKHDLLRRIPRDAEACTVLVGCLDYLEKPAMAFVRLAERQILENLTEVPLPVRFVFILLGPEGTMDYHEVGRSLSTLMSNQHFHEIAYKAESRSEILHAINEFLNESIVLPPGDWDQKTLLPVMDMARKRAKIRLKKLKKKEELEALLKKEELDKIPLDPLKRTGRPFGGLINDVKRRYPHYLSDFTDALNTQCLMALIFIFFACLASCIAFGGLIEEKTYGKMGVVETIISTSVTNIVFGFFSTQPLMLVGPTGPVLVFEKHLYYFCKTSHIEFLTWRVWIGLWVFIITILVIAIEGSFLVRYISRFTEEVFAILISLIFIFEVIHKLQEIYSEHPLRTKAFYCDNKTLNAMDSSPANYSHSSIPILNYTTIRTQQTSTDTTVDTSTVIYNKSDMDTTTDADDHLDEAELYKQMHHYSEHFNEPNTALLSTILIFGTFLIAYFLRIFRNSTFLGRSARRALGDFGMFIAMLLMVMFDYFLADTFTQKLNLPDTLAHTDRRLNSWFINPLGSKQPMEVWHMFVAVVPAFLIFILLFLEVQLTEMLLHKKEFKLKKGSGFHMDQFLLGLMTFVCAIFGLPWMCAATVRTIAHVSALGVMSRTHAPGEKPKLLEVKDQRVTNITMNVLIGTALMWGPVLRAVPIAVLFGVFLYLGVSAISGVQLYKRIKLLFMPVKHHPMKSYVRRVATMKMHLFTLIQIALVVILWIVKSTIAAIVFPLLVFLMIPLRLKILPKIFTHDELEVVSVFRTIGPLVGFLMRRLIYWIKKKRTLMMKKTKILTSTSWHTCLYNSSWRSQFPLAGKHTFRVPAGKHAYTVRACKHAYTVTTCKMPIHVKFWLANMHI